MSFIGTIGVVAQQGNQAVGSGNGVIASGNNSLKEGYIITNYHPNNCGYSDMNNDSTNPPDLSVDVAVGGFSAFDSCANSGSFKIYAYARNSSASTCTWSLSIDAGASSGFSGCTASIQGTAATAIDCTAATTSDGIGQYLYLEWGGGRGGQTYPIDGENIIVDVDCVIDGVAATTVSQQWKYET